MIFALMLKDGLMHKVIIARGTKNMILTVTSMDGVHKELIHCILWRRVVHVEEDLTSLLFHLVHHHWKVSRFHKSFHVANVSYWKISLNYL